MNDLLQEGIKAYQAGNRDDARKLFVAVVKQNKNDERAWGWMHTVSSSDKERIHCLKQMLRINPKNKKANEVLNKLTNSEAAELVEDSTINVNWNLVNKNVGSWASQHAAEQVTKIDDVTRKALNKTITKWNYEGGLGDLTERIMELKDATGNPCFDEQRAERIATTEATTIFAEANTAAWEKLGYPKAVFKPAAHINCRCYLQPMDRNGVKSILWYTAHDERVCVKPIDTKSPLGIVKGCRELHGMIVGSEDKKLLGTHYFHYGMVRTPRNSAPVKLPTKENGT